MKLLLGLEHAGGGPAQAISPEDQRLTLRCVRRTISTFLPASPLAPLAMPELTAVD